MKLIAAALLVALAAAPVRAAEDNSKLASLSAWFKNLKQGLSDSAVSGKFQRRRASAVAAVRGSEQDTVDPDRPEWKTSTKSEKVEMKKEKAELGAAVDMIVEGKFDEGKKAIDAFEAAHPKSKLLPEAKKARENAELLAQLKGAPKEESASTTPSEKPAEKAAEPKN